jgi:predicted CXXCH cytochrome family protein
VTIKRTLASAGAVLAVVALASLSYAGDYHAGINLVCQDCHVMHYSQQHGYNADGTGNHTALGAGGPNEFMLRNDVNDLCLSCHDGQAWAPDVFESHSNGYVRQAGALNEVGGNASYPPTSGHTLGSTDVAPGSNPPWSNPNGLECVDCHAAHGSGSAGNSYRNLGGFGTKPGSALGISYSRGDVEVTNDLTKWVFEDASSGVNANHYGRDHITFNEPDATKSKYAEFCKGCHTDFHGDVGGAEIGGTGTPPSQFVRHPASTANIGAVGGGGSSLSRFAGKTTNQLMVMSPTGVRVGSYTASNTDLTPSCMTCHKGHGNQNAFGLIFMVGTGTITEQGDAGTDARNTCRQCHGQGGTGAY